MKRIFDIVLACVALAVLSPLFAVISLATLLTIGRPILFSQTRPGLNEKPFRMFKFRSMQETYDASGTPLPDSMRVTKFGHFMRATSLDEVPELWNVLKGEMSLVGPRPLLMEYLELYNPEQARRHEVRPGLTGWAQVNGRNAISWEEKFKLDVWYVDNRSFWLDIKILLMTVKKVFVREGISADGHVTIEKFKGSSK